MLEHLRVPDVPSRFALVRVVLAGICNTDLELQRGYYNFSGIPGHEFVGTVVQSSDSKLQGRRVVGEINLACNRCDWCQRGWQRHCPRRSVLGIVNHPGAFADYVLLPERNLHVVPDHISDEEAVFIEPLAAACEVIDQVTLADGARVAVLGDGKLGLLISKVLKVHGANVVQYGRHANKFQISAAAGVTTVLNGSLPQKEFDVVVDATGSAEGLKNAVSMTRPRGTVVLKSTLHGEVSVDTAPVIVDELTLVGSRCGRFEPAIALLANRRVDVTQMVSDVLPLESAETAFTAAAKRGVLKVLLRP